MDTNVTSSTNENTRTTERAATPDRGQERGARPVEVTTFKHGSVIADPERTSTPVERLRVIGDTPRSFSDHQKQMLANLDATGDVDKPSASETTLRHVDGTSPGQPAKPAPAAHAAATPSAAPAAAAPAPAPEAAATPPPDLEEANKRAERALEHNRRLLAENQRLKSRPQQYEPDSRHKALDEIERSLTTDAIGSIRRLVALNAGYDDPKAPEVDRLMANLYAEWTGHELKLPMDPGKQALIETERNRILWARDKREQEAARKAAEKAEADARAARDQETKDIEVGKGINYRLESSNHADSYPLMMKYAEIIDRTSPGDLLWRAIRRGIASGEVTGDMQDDVVINHYSKQIESFYQDHLAKLGVAPQTSTAPTTQATVPVADKQADASQPGVRTITNASASVAPPAPPAPTPPAPNKPLKESEEARRRRLAAQHFGGD